MASAVLDLRWSSRAGSSRPTTATCWHGKEGPEAHLDGDAPETSKPRRETDALWGSQESEARQLRNPIYWNQTQGHTRFRALHTIEDSYLCPRLSLRRSDETCRRRPPHGGRFQAT